MKRLTSLVLALLLALTMMVGAFAETADVTGAFSFGNSIIMKESDNNQ